MSELRQPPQAGADTPATPEITDTRSAADALEGLLDFEDGAGEQDSGHAPDAGTGESPSTGDEEGQSETGEDPSSIAPPNSWSAEDQAKFRELPPALQAIVARREGERDRLLLQRGEEIANTRRAFEAERMAMQSHTASYQQSLQQLLALALPEAAQFQNVDWGKLASENPAEYVRLSGIRDQLRGRIGAINGEMQRVQQMQQAQQAQAIQQHLMAEQQRLVSAVPEFGDGAKAPALAKQLGDWLTQQGFNAAEIGSVMDHRMVRVALAAMRADVAARARTSAGNKVANQPPRVQQPGARSSNDRGDGRIREAAGRLRQTGSVRDAASLLENLI